MSGALIVIPTLLTAAAYVKRGYSVPELIQPSSVLGRHFLVPAEAHVVSAADEGLEVRPDRGRWPGVALEEVWPDWRGYSTLAIDLGNPGDDPVSLFVRIEDRRPDPSYAERFNERFDLAPMSRRVVRIPLAQIESAPAGPHMDLAHMQRIMLFEDGSAATHPFQLHSLRLER